MAGILSPYLAALDGLEGMRHVGEVVEVAGLLVESAGPVAAIGDFCEIMTSTPFAASTSKTLANAGAERAWVSIPRNSGPSICSFFR